MQNNLSVVKLVPLTNHEIATVITYLRSTTPNKADEQIIVTVVNKLQIAARS